MTVSKGEGSVTAQPRDLTTVAKEGVGYDVIKKKIAIYRHGAVKRDNVIVDGGHFELV